MIVGITGQTATGKTTLSNMFRKFGYTVFDADKVYNTLLKSNNNLQKELLTNFGSFDKKIILKLITDEPSLTNNLNEITHKYVIKEVLDFININNGQKIVLDVPIPVEKGFLDVSQIIIVTTCSHQEQIKRLMNRYNINQIQADERISLQKPIEKYLTIADIVVNTQNTTEKELIGFVKIFENTYMLH